MDNDHEATLCGKFGYEVFGGQYIPYIFRGKERCCATKVFSWHFQRMNIKLESNLLHFGYLKGYQMNRAETYLMTEINEWHNNGMYSQKFTQKDSLIKLEDAMDIFKYVDECMNKLTVGHQYRMTSARLARIWLPKSKQDIVLPYIMKNSQRFVPVHILFASNNIPEMLDVTNLTDIDVMYMRFLLNVLKINLTSQQFEIPCVNLDRIVEYLTASQGGPIDYDDNYWPSKENTPLTGDYNKIPFFTSPWKTSNNNNNNSVEQIKVPMKRKHDSPVHEETITELDMLVTSEEPQIVESMQNEILLTTDTPKPSKKPKIDEPIKKTKESETMKELKEAEPEMEPKEAEPEKAEPKEPKKVESKKPEPKQATKKVEPEKPEPKEELKKNEPKKESKKVESKTPEPKPEPKKVEPKKEPKKTTSKNPMGNKKNTNSKTKTKKVDETFYEVDELLDYKKEKGVEKLLVKWKGNYDDTWEPVSSLNSELMEDVEELRQKYAKQLKAKKK